MYKPGKSKEYIRNSVFLYFKDCNNILTLPNLYFGLEKMLLKEGKQVTCSEYDVNTFKGQNQIAPKNIKLINSDVTKIELSEYDGIFLDLYGNYNENVANALESLQIGCKIAITFLMARESKKLQKIIDIKDRENSYIRVFKKHGITITKYANYYDTTPMCVFFGAKN